MVHLYADVISVIASFADHGALNRLSQVCAEARRVVADVYVPTHGDIGPIILQRHGFLLKQLRKLPAYHHAMLVKFITSRRYFDDGEGARALRYIKAQLGVCISTYPRIVKRVITRRWILDYMIEIGVDILATVPNAVVRLINADGDSKHVMALIKDPRYRPDRNEFADLRGIRDSAYVAAILSKPEINAYVANIYRLPNVAREYIFDHPTFVFSGVVALNAMCDVPLDKLKKYCDRLTGPRSNGVMQLYYALRTNNMKMAELCVDNIIATSSSVCWPLWCAASECGADAVEMLLARPVFDTVGFVEWLMIHGAQHSDIISRYIVNNQAMFDYLAIQARSSVSVWMSNRCSLSDRGEYHCRLLHTRLQCGTSPIINHPDVDYYHPPTVDALIYSALRNHDVMNHLIQRGFKHVLNEIKIDDIHGHAAERAYTRYYLYEHGSVEPIINSAVVHNNKDLIIYLIYNDHFYNIDRDGELFADYSRDDEDIVLALQGPRDKVKYMTERRL